MANSYIVLKSKIVKHVTNIDENCKNARFEERFRTNMGFKSICVVAMQKGVHAQVFILIYMDVANNFAHGHFTSKAFFQFEKFNIIVNLIV